jgi:hypothetical protein
MILPDAVVPVSEGGAIVKGKEALRFPLPAEASASREGRSSGKFT